MRSTAQRRALHCLRLSRHTGRAARLAGNPVRAKQPVCQAQGERSGATELRNCGSRGRAPSLAMEGPGPTWRRVRSSISRRIGAGPEASRVCFVSRAPKEGVQSERGRTPRAGGAATPASLRIVIGTSSAARRHPAPARARRRPVSCTLRRNQVRPLPRRLVPGGRGSGPGAPDPARPLKRRRRRRISKREGTRRPNGSEWEVCGREAAFGCFVAGAGGAWVRSSSVNACPTSWTQPVNAALLIGSSFTGACPVPSPRREGWCSPC